MYLNLRVMLYVGCWFKIYQFAFSFQNVELPEFRNILHPLKFQYCRQYSDPVTIGKHVCRFDFLFCIQIQMKQMKGKGKKRLSQSQYKETGVKGGKKLKVYIHYIHINYIKFIFRYRLRNFVRGVSKLQQFFSVLLNC